MSQQDAGRTQVMLRRGMRMKPADMTTRATRLLHLLDDLHRRRRPVRGAQLADQLGISLRTLYRDIDAFRAQGAVIAGDPGAGYSCAPVSCCRR